MRMLLTQNLIHDRAVNIRKAEVTALESIRKLSVIKAEKLK